MATRCWVIAAEKPSFCRLSASVWTFFRLTLSGVYHKRMDVRPGGGGGRDEPWGKVCGTRHQSVPSGKWHEGLPERTQAGEDWSQGPGTRALENSVSIIPARVHAKCWCPDTLALPSFLLLLKDTAELFFEDVRLPASAVLGELNKGFYYLMNELPQVKATWELQLH